MSSILVGTTFVCFKTIQNPVNQYVTGFCFSSKTTKNGEFSRIKQKSWGVEKFI